MSPRAHAWGARQGTGQPSPSCQLPLQHNVCAASRAVALCAGGEERSVALELPARGRGAKADHVWDVSLVDVGVVALPLSLGGGGPVSLVGQLDRANWQGVARDAGERTVDGCKCGVVAGGGVGGIEAGWSPGGRRGGPGSIPYTSVGNS